jgi:hypothetical protein
MKKYILVLIITLFLIKNNALAQSPTAPINDNGEIQKIREKVEQKVNEKLQEMENKTINKKISIIGAITKIEDNIITIERKNMSRSIKIDDETIIVNNRKTSIKTEDLVVGQNIIAMGYKNNDQVLLAKRIVFVDKKDTQINKIITAGNVVDISQTSPVFVLIPSKNKETQYQITIDNKITKIVNKEKQKITSKEIKAGSKLIVSISPTTENNKNYLANYIIVLN